LERSSLAKTVNALFRIINLYIIKNVYIVNQYTLTKGADVKKSLAIVLTVLFMVGLCAPSFAAKTDSKMKAAEKYDRIVAEVVSLDTAAKTMVIKEEKSGVSRTITISAKAAAELKVGDRVRIKLRAGTNESAGVRVLGAKPVVEDTAAGTAVGTATGTASQPEAQPKTK
jgi:hypothetical protein